MKKFTVGLIGICAVAIVFVFVGLKDKNVNSEPSSDQDQQISSNVDTQTTSNDETQDVVKKEIKAEVEAFSFEDAVHTADLIVEVTIGKIIKELSSPSPKTLYEAVINTDYNGQKNGENIQVLQQGNEEWSFNNNKPFEENEKYILFLKKAEGPEFEGTNTYWILGEETTTYSIIDENKIMKNAEYDNELASIEDTVLSNDIKKNKKVAIENGRKGKKVIKVEKEVQVLEKKKFEEKIKKSKKKLK